MNVNEKNKITHAIGEYFLRVVKNHNYYIKFKNTFYRVNKIHRYRLIELTNKDVYMGIISNFANSAESEYNNHRSNDIYEYITIFINLLLRHYLEASGVDPRKLGMIGQELFDLSCLCVFGDKYLQDMNNIQQMTGRRAPRNDKEAWAMGEFEARIRQGEKLDFEEFMKAKASIPDELFWNCRIDGRGLMDNIAENNENQDDILEDYFDDYFDNNED